MEQFGILETQELVSVPFDDEGNPNLDSLAPNPKPDDWTPPEVVPLVKLDPPELADDEISDPVLNWFPDRVERAWSVRTITEDEYRQLHPVPDSVQSHQLFTALSRAGIQEDTIAAIVAGMPDEQAKMEADIAIRRAPNIRRDHPLVTSIANVLGLSARNVDDIFRTAETI